MQPQLGDVQGFQLVCVVIMVSPILGETINVAVRVVILVSPIMGETINVE
jgi:hypothetical protein